MIEKIILPNGVRVLSEHIPHVRSASVGVWIGNGSRYESADESGMSHFLEHMLFKGTATRTASQLASEMDALGGQFNAFTTKECTSFYFRALDTDLIPGITLLGDILLNSAFPEAELGIERGVIDEEIGMYEDTPDELCTERLFNAVYPGSPLGFSILGDRAALDRVTPGSMRAYFDTHYVSSNIVVAISGNFDQRTLEFLRETFAGVKAAPSPVYVPAVYCPADTTREKPLEQNHICLGFQGFPFGVPERYAAQIFSSILGGGMSSRLFRKVREENGLCYSIYTFQSSHADTGVSGVYVATGQKTQSAALDMIRAETLRLTSDGPTPEELERVRGQIKANVLMGLESTVSRMNHMARSELLLGYVPTQDEIVAKYDEVTMERCVDTGRRLFDFATGSSSVVGRVSWQLKYGRYAMDLNAYRDEVKAFLQRMNAADEGIATKLKFLEEEFALLKSAASVGDTEKIRHQVYDMLFQLFTVAAEYDFDLVAEWNMGRERKEQKYIE